MMKPIKSGISGTGPPKNADANVGAAAVDGSQNKREAKRMTLILPAELHDELSVLAEERQVTVMELLRRFVKLGLIAAELEKEPNSALLFRRGDTTERIVLI